VRQGRTLSWASWMSATLHKVLSVQRRQKMILGYVKFLSNSALASDLTFSTRQAGSLGSSVALTAFDTI